MLDDATLREATLKLDRAERDRRPNPQLGPEYPSITIDAAYARVDRFPLRLNREHPDCAG